MSENQQIFKSLEDVHKEIPQTQCSQKNECCKAGCPPMHSSEFNYLLDYFNSELDSNQKKEVLSRCIDNYFSLKIIKPCPLFDDGCLIYEARPINCRVYGIIPDCRYARRRKRDSDSFTMSAKEIKDQMGLEKIQDVPLYNQCQCVKIVKEGKEKDEKMSTILYDDIFKKLIEIEGKFLSNSNIKNSDNSYKTFHDHYLFKLVGETVLRKWTTIKMSIGNDSVLLKDVVNKMKNNLKINDKGILNES
jgi:Fe-S-cluster containining protein